VGPARTSVGILVGEARLPPLSDPDSGLVDVTRTSSLFATPRTALACAGTSAPEDRILPDELETACTSHSGTQKIRSLDHRWNRLATRVVDRPRRPDHGALRCRATRRRCTFGSSFFRWVERRWKIVWRRRASAAGPCPARYGVVPVAASEVQDLGCPVVS